jgi:hypothetical protein
MRNTIGAQQHQLVSWLGDYNKVSEIEYETG